MALSVSNPFEQLLEPLRALGIELDRRCLNPLDQFNAAAQNFRDITARALAGNTEASSSWTRLAASSSATAEQVGASPAQAAATREVQTSYSRRWASSARRRRRHSRVSRARSGVPTKGWSTRSVSWSPLVASNRGNEAFAKKAELGDQPVPLGLRPISSRPLSGLSGTPSAAPPALQSFALLREAGRRHRTTPRHMRIFLDGWQPADARAAGIVSRRRPIRASNRGDLRRDRAQ